MRNGVSSASTVYSERSAHVYEATESLTRAQHRGGCRTGHWLRVAETVVSVYNEA